MRPVGVRCTRVETGMSSKAAVAAVSVVGAIIAVTACLCAVRVVIRVYMARQVRALPPVRPAGLSSN